MEGLFQIGELSRRVGISADTLRVWERRYGVPSPTRSDGGYRLYSELNEWHVRLMQEQIVAGMAPAQAARAVRAATPPAPRGMPAAGLRADGLAQELAEALEAFDESGAHLVLDRTFASLGLERAISEVLIPYLHEVGERWARGDLTVGQEHFASRLIEGRLLAMARGWNRAPGPKAVLACPPGEQHTLPLIAFGLALRNRGWRSVYLGADAPPSTVLMAVDTVEPEILVMSAARPECFAPIVRQLSTLATKATLLLAGAGATPEIVARAHARPLSGDPVQAAERLSLERVGVAATPSQ